MFSRKKAFIVGGLLAPTLWCLYAVVVGYARARFVLSQCALSVPELMVCLALVVLGVVGVWVGGCCIYDEIKN